MSESSGIYEQERRAKLQKLRDLGVDPYGQRTVGVQPLKAVKQSYTPEMGHDGGPKVLVAGRVVLKRDMGKLTFASLRDDSGEDLQVAFDRKRLDAVDPKFWQINDLIDLGDVITVEGNLGTTKKGETTIWATGIGFAAKSLLPPPGKWDGLSDVESRYRQRYVDLWANPGVMKIMQMRSRVIAEIRSYLSERGFLEVETPMMQVLHGGAAARPFKTHHQALDMPLFMRIAPELYLKRLLVGGYSKVFELNRNFRNEGISPRHNPEFTMLEAYEAYGSWETMADLVEGMICHIAEKLFGGLKIEHRNSSGEVTKTIDLTRPWRRVTMSELVLERTGFKFSNEPVPADVIAKLRSENPGKDLKLVGSPAEQLVEIYEKLIESTLVNPTYVTQVPSVIIPLARKNPADPFFADVYELAINGQEISPGYSELNDPDVQAENFRHQVGDKEEQQQVDEDFLSALKYGMPPAGGMGMGIDRLLMLLTGAESIRDVILFPLMRPEN